MADLVHVVVEVCWQGGRQPQDEGDAALVGVYGVVMTEDEVPEVTASDLDAGYSPEDKWTGYALDHWHNKHGIENVDDLEITASKVEPSLHPDVDWHHTAAVIHAGQLRFRPA